MSTRYETDVTLTVDGDELDVRVRAHVAYGAFGMGGAMGAELDGEIEALVAGAWVPLESLELSAGDIECAEEALAEEALNDDSDQCVDRDDDLRDCA